MTTTQLISIYLSNPDAEEKFTCTGFLFHYYSYWPPVIPGIGSACQGAEAAACNGCCLFLSGVVKFMQLSVIASHYQLILDIYFCKRYQTQSHFKTGAAEYKELRSYGVTFLNSPTR
jgi:hypothetical protein